MANNLKNQQDIKVEMADCESFQNSSSVIFVKSAQSCSLVDLDSSEEQMIVKHVETIEKNELYRDKYMKLLNASSSAENSTISGVSCDGLNYSSFVKTTIRSSTPNPSMEIVKYISGRFDDADSDSGDESIPAAQNLLSYPSLMPKILTASVDCNNEKLNMYAEFNEIVHPLQIIDIAQKFSQSPREFNANLSDLLNYRSNDFVSASMKVGIKIFIRGHCKLQSYGWKYARNDDEICPKCKKYKADMTEFHCNQNIFCEFCAHSMMLRSNLKCNKCNNEVIFLYKQK